MRRIHYIDQIASDPAVRGGKAHILNTTVTVLDIVTAMVHRQQDVAGVMRWFGLDAAQVYAALAYYHAHKDEIDGAMRGKICLTLDLEKVLAGEATSITATGLTVDPAAGVPVQHVILRDGEAVLTRRGIPVAAVVQLIVKGGCPVDAAIAQFGLTRAEVHAALAYYYDHQTVIDQQLDPTERLAR